MHFLSCLIIYWSHFSQLSNSIWLRELSKNAEAIDSPPFSFRDSVTLNNGKKIANSSEYFWNVGQPKMCDGTWNGTTNRYFTRFSYVWTWSMRYVYCNVWHFTRFWPLCDGSAVCQRTQSYLSEMGHSKCNQILGEDKRSSLWHKFRTFSELSSTYFTQKRVQNKSQTFTEMMLPSNLLAGIIMRSRFRLCTRTYVIEICVFGTCAPYVCAL